MNSALLSLELRKNRLTLIGLAAACALIPPLSLLVARRQGLETLVALHAGMWWWVIVGLPLAAVIFGAAAGAGLRRPDTREAEAPLPGSAAGRVWRGLTGAHLQFLILMLATALIGTIATPGWTGAIFDAPADPKAWAGAMFYRGLVAYLAVDLISTCFFVSYALDNAVAGGLLGSLLALGENFVIHLCLQYHVFFPERIESFAPIIVLVVLIGLAAKAAAIRPLAARFERSRPLGLGGGAAAFALITAGLLFACGALALAYTQLRSSLRLVKPSASVFDLSFTLTTDEAEAALSPAVRRAGELATTVAGGLFWIAPEGRLSRLLADGDSGPLIVPGPAIESVVWDEEGRLLVARRAASSPAMFWVGRPQSGLHPVDPALGVPEHIGREGGAVGIRFRTGGEIRFCVMDDEGRARKCAPSVSPWIESRSFGPQTLPLAARLSTDGLALSRPAPRARTWRLPGRAADHDSTPATVPAYLVGGKPAYFVPVRIKDDEAVAVCLDDGRVKTVWRHAWSGVRPFGGLTLDVLPDGTLVHQYAYDWFVVDPSGQFLPAIKSKGLFERWPRPAGAKLYTPQLVHRAGGHAWIVFEGNRLVEMDENTGTPLKDWPLPAVALKAGSFNSLRVLEGGIILQEFSSPFFISWNGQTRALRAP